MRRPFWSPTTSIIILAALALALALAPWPPLLKLRALGFGLDPQRPAHSFFLGGEPMPIEARKVGIYAGFALAALGLAWAAPRADRLARQSSYFAILAAGSVMALDGTNALFYDLGLPHLYAPRLDLRLATGLLAGLALGALLWPVWAQAAWRVPRGTVRARHFALPALVSVGLLAVLVTGQPWAMGPVSLLASAGLWGVVAMINAVVLLAALRRDATADGWRDLLDVVVVALVLALAELLALAALRYVLIGTTPLP